MQIIAHRGNDNIHKENSYEAIINSLNKDYIDGIEIDIRFTKDCKFIISHDPFYQGYFIEHTKIKKLLKKGLNSLEEILENINTNKIIMIEIKSEDKRPKKLINNLYNLLSKYNLNYYLCSFNYNLIKDLKKIWPQSHCGLIIGYNINTKHFNAFDFNSINHKSIKRKITKETFIWTINNEEILKKINKKYNIITDKAKEMSNFINKS